MPKSHLVEAEGLVLNRAPAGERHLRLTLLTPSLGLIIALFRESRPAGGTATKSSRTRAGVMEQPDVFDHANVQLETPKPGAAHGAAYFVREYKVLRRHAGLGRHYAALESAAALATFVAHNARHFETCAPVFDLCRKAFAALDEGAAPEAVRLKALFLIARAEGYAALEQWFPALSGPDQALVLFVINRPAAEAAALAAADATRLPRLRRAFERWLAEHTDLEIK
jgi:hypothetical protein